VYLSAAEARKRIGVSRETLRKLIKSGALTAHKSGTARNSHYRITEQAVAESLERQTVEATR
jgi:excisionase family DNA binding protein